MGGGSAIDNLLPSLRSGSDYHTEMEGANHEAFYRCYSRWADNSPYRSQRRHRPFGVWPAALTE